MPNKTSLFTQPVADIRAQLSKAREARASQQALWRDLAAYTTESDLNDLSAILDRYDDSDTRDIRRILTAQHH